jgi:hypothetical protein
VRSIIDVLYHPMRDLTSPVRELLMNHATCLPELLAALTQRSPAEGSRVSSRFSLLLTLLGVTPEEFLDAVNFAQRPPQPAPTADPVGEFLERITADDICALDRVLSVDVPLDVALPIFVEQNKDVVATIEQINRMRSAR